MESKAFAKINLHLEVLNKRQDGYHEILSLMAEIGVFDLLKLVETRPRETVSVSIVPDGGAYPEILHGIPGDENLIAKAVRAYCREAGITGEYVFSLRKNIPAGAGMGGGSADAAAALRLMNARYNRLSHDALARVALGVGADVPFCLNGGVAICTGIGEKIERLDVLPDWTVLVADMGIHVDTRAAYSMLGRGDVPRFDDSILLARVEKLGAALRTGNLNDLCGMARNDFEDVVFERHPAIREARDGLRRGGAVCAFMTGSGSAVVGLFRGEKEAWHAEEELKGLARSVIITGFAGGRNR
ncbi:MAG: 4-(cytidine 5'-diphospho)-2-C-methyl-D-erythritol kinase [Spirochaetes bacterium]|nr:4-(cytidine 5'-diphospho)-2-C-methyl-D-erythritol kinase [Spirochaetota bacterium]